MQKEFEQHAREWEEYCGQDSMQLNGTPYDRVNCQPYRDIVALGLPAMELLAERYGKTNTVVGPAWVTAIRDIAKDSKIECELSDSAEKLAITRRLIPQWLSRIRDRNKVIYSH